jgi:hypothetical protein
MISTGKTSNGELLARDNQGMGDYCRPCYQFSRQKEKLTKEKVERCSSCRCSFSSLVTERRLLG